MSNQRKERIALVSRSLNSWDCSTSFRAIAAKADEERCETILYALWTLHIPDRKFKPYKEMLFGNSKHIKRVVIEIGDLSDETENNFHVQFWERNRSKPTVMYRRFAKSSDPVEDKEQFIKELPKCKISSMGAR